MQIDPTKVEQLKRNTDLVSYIASRGITLNKNGKNHKGLCPFHEETTPSFTINPLEGLWHCFGCGAGGDVFSFVERLDKVSFTRAVGIVGKGVGRGLSSPSSYVIPAEEPGSSIVKKDSGSPIKSGMTNNQTATLTPSHQKLLNRIIQFYQQELWKDRRGLNYLKQRGLSDKQSLLDFGVGFVSGNLLEILPSDGDYEAALKQIGILNEKGHEMFYGSVVFPLLDFNNNCVGLYGRRIDEEQVKHLYLPGPRRGLINRQAAKRSKTLFLTESIIDALSLYANGFKNVIPLYGVNGWTEDHAKLFEIYPPEVVYVCFDSDEAGIKGAYAVKEKIKEGARGWGIGDSETIPYTLNPIPCSTHTLNPIPSPRAKIHIVKLPTKDINDYFQKYRASEFEQLIKESNPDSVEASEVHYVRDERLYEPTEYGFMVAFGKREYEIKGIAKMGTQLKATIKASLDIKGADACFQITTLDFYSQRSREWFSKVVSELTGEREELCREDLKKILTKIEVFNPTKPHTLSPKPLTKEEEHEALTFLNNPNIFDEILADLETLGCTREETNKLVAYLVAVSRKMDEPLSLLIQSRSAAGKSTLQDAILSLIPEEDFLKYTRLTDQALFYKEENSLVHKILALEEVAGMRGSAYSIRAIQSSKHLTVATTSKDPATGKMKTEEYTVNGPLSIMLTTTEVDLDAEMESRFLTIAIDESTEMTKKIHEKQRNQETLEGYLLKRKGEVCIHKHQNAHRLLKPLVVVNPYAPYLNFPSENLRSRRDHKKYLNLIKVVTFLRQYQRKVRTTGDRVWGIGDSETIPYTLNPIPFPNIPFSYIEVTLDDITMANKLANEVLGRSLDDISASSRDLLHLIHRMVTEKSKELGLSSQDFSFNRRLIREYAKWSDWQVKHHIKELEELGFVYSRIGSKGKEYVYELHHEVPNEPTKKVYLGLTEISQLEKVKVNLEGVKPNLVAL